jgi:predicted dehydrogenase
MDEPVTRRDLIKGSAVALGFAAAGALNAEPLTTVRVGFVGVGGRGNGLLQSLVRLDNVKVNALCDINENNLARAMRTVERAGMPKPEGYSRGPHDFERMVERNDLDLVINAATWEWHTPISVAAMKAGKHAATEVPAAQTVEQCWELVETSEKTGKQCAILENDCYYRDVMMVLTMLRRGLLGEPLYSEAGYMHDIRGVKFGVGGGGEPWRAEQAVHRNGNLYPTHPLGPLSWWNDINRGDQFSYLVSMSSKSRSLKEFATKTFGAEDPRAKRDYALGDVNITLIHTEKGRTICLYHDTNTPRPKEHLVRIQGTKGVFNRPMSKMFVDGRSNGLGENRWRTHNWEALDEYAKEYDSRLWQEQEKNSQGAGHNGVDYLELYRLVKNLRHGAPLDIDVYDAAAWSVIVPLTEASVAGRSKPMDVPDFTRGKWKIRQPIDPEAIV